LDLVGLADLAGRYPDELSGGQQQRVALARALAPSPRIVLLDEPFANLDAALRLRVREEVRQILHTAGTAAILVTHDQEEALSIADRVAVMKDGRILQIGPPEEIYHTPATPEVAAFVGDGRLVPCSVKGGRVRCPYGTAITEAPDGEGRLFLRPEDLVLHPAGAAAEAAEDGLLGRVKRRTFFGHDLLTEVEFPDGDLIQVRRLSSADTDSAPGAHLGSRVRVGLRPKVFPVFEG
jgi:iron(III) transport system ATP-binding protein